MNSLEHIRRVDIEIQSFCNRTCEWCPNKTYLRDKSVQLEDQYFTKILDELIQFGFAPRRQFATSIPSTGITFKDDIIGVQPTVSFIGYQEPMADIKLLKRRVIEAKKKLPPYVVLTTNTNGDYFTKKNLDGLPLTSLNVMDYDCKGKDYWLEKLKECGCFVINDPSSHFHGITAVHKNINVIRVVYDWPKHAYLENRAGALSKEDQTIKFMKWQNDSAKRIVPCCEPSYFINITFDGNVMPCCHIRSDIPMHKDYILGNIKHETLEEIFNSDKAVKFRNSLITEYGDYPEPCKNCQKIRSGECTGAPNGFNYDSRRYLGNAINERYKIS